VSAVTVDSSFLEPWKRRVAAAGLALLCSAPVLAQATDNGSGSPTLHQRTEQTYGDVRSRKNPQVPSTLPSEASGEYLMGKPGDVIEIILDSNGLTGYISMIGRTDKDKDAALTYFFDDTQLDAKSLSFTTRPVHGAYYSFLGTIVRGPAPTKAKEGYYLLQGTLTLHNTADKSEEPRRVALPLARTIDG
jgi:hypothetical protein